MIDKLYKLKKTQTDRKISEQGNVQNQINNIEDEITKTNISISTTSVTRHGAISDFSVLQIHKNTMKIHVTKLENKKNLLVSQLAKILEEVIELQKETEQFGYIVEEERKEALKKMLLAEEEAATEYMQSKYIKGQ